MSLTLEVAEGLGVAEEAGVGVGGGGGAEGAEERAEAAEAEEGEPRGRVAEAAPQRLRQVAVHAPPLRRRRPPPPPPPPPHPPPPLPASRWWLTPCANAHRHSDGERDVRRGGVSFVNFAE